MSLLNPIPHRSMMVALRWFTIFMQVLGAIIALDRLTDKSDLHPWQSYAFLGVWFIVAFILKRIANAELQKHKDQSRDS